MNEVFQAEKEIIHINEKLGLARKVAEAAGGKYAELV